MAEPKSVTFDRLASLQTANRQPYFKITFFLTKKAGLSDEEFHRHWETLHADLTVATKGFRDILGLRYVQFHQTPEIKAVAETLGYPVLPYDGCTEMYVRHLEDWKAFSSSPEFFRVLGGDAAQFLDSKSAIMAGYENIIFGKAISGLGGTDGLLPEDL
ncbi:hypothetical protein RBB50_010763 [Rhinocladiella similis]